MFAGVVTLKECQLKRDEADGKGKLRQGCCRVTDEKEFMIQFDRKITEDKPCWATAQTGDKFTGVTTWSECSKKNGELNVNGLNLNLAGKKKVKCCFVDQTLAWGWDDHSRGTTCERRPRDLLAEKLTYADCVDRIASAKKKRGRGHGTRHKAKGKGKSRGGATLDGSDEDAGIDSGSTDRDDDDDVRSGGGSGGGDTPSRGDVSGGAADDAAPSKPESESSSKEKEKDKFSRGACQAGATAGQCLPWWRCNAIKGTPESGKGCPGRGGKPKIVCCV